jgi:hypothetical protein
LPYWHGRPIGTLSFQQPCLSATNNYIALAGQPFEAPDNPLIQPVHPAGATGPTSTLKTRAPSSPTATPTAKAPCKRLIDSIPLIYISKALYYANTIGWGNIVCLQLLDHLCIIYGLTMSAALEANLLAIKQPWTVEVPIKTVFTQLNKSITFSTPSQYPITNNTAISAGGTRP